MNGDGIFPVKIYFRCLRSETFVFVYGESIENYSYTWFKFVNCFYSCF